MIRRLHQASTRLALGLIMTFMGATILVELLGYPEEIARIKQLIWYGVFLLVPAMAAAGISGALLAKGREHALIRSKRRRMPIIALNGLLVLVPCAYILADLSASGAYGARFYTVQGVELLAGGVNLLLMLRSYREGKGIKFL